MGQAKSRKAEIEQLKCMGKAVSDAGLVSIAVIRNGRCLIGGSMSKCDGIEQISTKELAGAHLAVADIKTQDDQKTMFFAAQRFLCEVPEGFKAGGFYIIDVASQGFDKPAILYGYPCTKEQWASAQRSVH